MAEITPSMLDKDALEKARRYFLDTNPLGETVHPDNVIDTFIVLLNALLASGKAVFEDREDWENSLQSIKRSTFLVIKLR